MKANALFEQSTSKTKDKFADLFTEKLIGYFKPDILGHLVYKYGSGQASVKIALDAGELAYTFGEKALLAKSDNNTYIQAAGPKREKCPVPTVILASVSSIRV